MTRAKPAPITAPCDLTPGSRNPGPVERSILAVRRYRALLPLSYEERGLVLEQLCHELRTLHRRGWWEWDRVGPVEDVSAWAARRGWRGPEVRAALEFLSMTGEIR